jgi:hypothetical protein
MREFELGLARFSQFAAPFGDDPTARKAQSALGYVWSLMIDEIFEPKLRNHVTLVPGGPTQRRATRRA